eukprot:6292703-Lingulodinium_polyedra.AAC.1
MCIRDSFKAGHIFELNQEECHVSKLAKQVERERTARGTKRGQTILDETFGALKRFCAQSQGSSG